MKDDLSPTRWEHFPQIGADVGIRGRGASLAEAFEQAGLALTGIVTDAEIWLAEADPRRECSSPVMRLIWVDSLDDDVHRPDQRMHSLEATVNGPNPPAGHPVPAFVDKRTTSIYYKNTIEHACGGNHAVGAAQEDPRNRPGNRRAQRDRAV